MLVNAQTIAATALAENPQVLLVDDDSLNSVQAAYVGFIDSYRQIPRDMDLGIASQAIGVTIIGGGNGNGRLDNDPADTTTLFK